MPGHGLSRSAKAGHGRSWPAKALGGQSQPWSNIGPCAYFAVCQDEPFRIRRFVLVSVCTRMKTRTKHDREFVFFTTFRLGTGPAPGRFVLVPRRFVLVPERNVLVLGRNGLVPKTTKTTVGYARAPMRQTGGRLDLRERETALQEALMAQPLTSPGAVGQLCRPGFWVSAGS